MLKYSNLKYTSIRADSTSVGPEFAENQLREILWVELVKAQN